MEFGHEATSPAASASSTSNHDHHDVSGQRYLKDINNQLRKDWEFFLQYLEKEGFVPQSHRFLNPLHSKLSASSSSSFSRSDERKPLDLSHHINKITKRRNPSIIKSFYKYFFIPGIRNLAGGWPSPVFFPYDTLEGAVAAPNRDLSKIDEDENGSNYYDWQHESGMRVLSDEKSKLNPGSSWWRPSARRMDPDGEENITKKRVIVPKYGPPGSNPFTEISLSSALQYGRASGYGPLCEFVKDFTFNYLHKSAGGIPYASPGPDIILTCGNTDGFSKVCQMLLEEGDYLLAEEFTYMNALQTATPFGVTIVSLKSDENGLCPEDFKRVMSTWQDPGSGISRRPRVLYTVSIGQNPTGSTAPYFRLKEIYSICEEYDIIIVEDQPYWHLQFQNPNPPSENSDGGQKNKDFLSSLLPGYITLDTSGRVIRLDTFSKTIAPGCRLGWITAQSSFIERLFCITETSTQQPSGFVQVLVVELLTKWGMQGWIGWLENLRDGYETKMKVMVDELEKGKYLLCESEDPDSDCSGSLLLVNKTELFDFRPPKAGMFLWMHVNISSHPVYQSLVVDSPSPSSPSTYLMRKLFVYLTTPGGGNILVCPGFIFAATKETLDERKGDEYFRFSFAFASEEIIREGVRGFNNGVRKFWGLSRKEIEEVAETGKKEEGEEGEKEE